ncbi:MAG TPA: hypothetical protein VJT32_00470, partial [bacterium]|nr:hypothetical protein [bacterium]
MTATSGPASLRAGGVFEHAFVVGSPGEAWASLTLAAPGTSWRDARVAVVEIEVDDRDRQEVILAGGDEPTEYLRLLGRLAAGSHRLRLRIQPDLTSPDAAAVTVDRVQTRFVGDEDPAAPVWRHAPVVHYRAVTSPLDSLTSDTPLLLFYRTGSDAHGTVIEYHLIFSHEDAGTDLPGLLARWGHTVDIEWVFRVTLDGTGRPVREEVQGPEHRTLRYAGGRALGGHPVLQVATLNGTVTDQVRSCFWGALAPACAQPEGEPREGVLQRFPWIYRVSALEVLRQVPLDDPSPDSRGPADLRSYVYVQWKRPPGPETPLEAAVRVGGNWYASAWGQPDLAFAGPDAESTAVKVPIGTDEAAITGIALRALEPPGAPLAVRLVRAFLLDDRYGPRPSFAAGGVCLTRRQPHAAAWE